MVSTALITTFTNDGTDFTSCVAHTQNEGCQTEEEEDPFRTFGKHVRDMLTEIA